MAHKFKIACSYRHVTSVLYTVMMTIKTSLFQVTSLSYGDHYNSKISLHLKRSSDLHQ